jgi:hypothetical protein
MIKSNKKLWALLLYSFLGVKAFGNNIETKLFANSDIWLWIAIVVEGLLLVAAFVFIWLRTRSERIKTIIKESERMERKFILRSEFIQRIQNINISIFEDKLQQLERRMGDLHKRFEAFSSSLMPDQSQDLTGMSQTPPSIKSEVKYLKQRNGNIFNQTSDSPEGSYFQAFNIKNDRASFKFSGNEDYAINNKNEVFDDVCEVSGSTLNARTIQNEENGEITLQDGKWKVTKKARIKFK